jgi:hypothetical protein
MNWTVFGLDMAISLSIAWFIARPSNLVQAISVWGVFFIVSLGAAIASEGVQTWRSVVIFTLPLAALATYTSIVLWQMERLGNRWNDAPTILDWWRQDAGTNDRGQDVGNGGPQPSSRNVEEAIKKSI